MPSFARLFALIALAAALPALAIPHPAAHVVHERRHFSPEARGWKLARRLESETLLPLRIGLTQSNLHTIEDVLNDVAHPDSANYGQHWSTEDVVNYFAPSRDTIAAVATWLTEAGISRDRLRLSASKGWIDVTVTAAEVEELLKTEYHVWEDETGSERVGCGEYSVPAHVVEHVDLIKPTTYMGARISPQQYKERKRALQTIAPPVKLGSPSGFNGPKTNGKKVDGSTTLGLADCDEFITPICLQTLYNFKNYRPISTHKNTFGIVEFTPQAFLQPDLDMFFHNFSKTQVGQKPILVSIDGGVAQTTNQSFNFNGESDLDLEYGMVLTNPQPVLLLQTGDLVEGAGFDNWLDAVDKSFCTFEGTHRYF